MDKKILITNKSAIQKLKQKKLKREISKQWGFDISNSSITEILDYTIQKDLLQIVYMNTTDSNSKDKHSTDEYTTQYIYVDDIQISKYYILKLIQSEIKKKLNSYTQQDKEKKMYVSRNTFDFERIVELLVKQKLKCSYCMDKMYVLYDNYRCSKQWSLDRVDNTKGHNIDNCVISCLQCNLQKKRLDDDDFRFTKQMKVIKL